MRSSTFAAASLGLVVATALGGCGSLDANTNDAPALATLKGNLSNPNPQSVDLSSGAVRIAVVWRTEAQGAFNVAEDLPVQPVFPSAFKIAFDGPPPAGAMNTADDLGGGNSSSGTSSSPPPDAGVPGAGPAPIGDIRYRPFAAPADVPSDLQFAYGAVVAYVDQNGNGKLDLVASGASAYVDQIVAANQGLVVTYFQGTIPSEFADPAGHLPTAGYNLLAVPACTEKTAPVTSNPACTTVPDAGVCTPMQWLGMDTLYELAITATPEVANMMCLSNAQQGSSSSDTGTMPQPVSVQPASYPDPCSPDLSCSSDGSSYQFATCTTVSNGICEGFSSSCTSVGYTRPTPVPAGWPCGH